MMVVSMVVMLVDKMVDLKVVYSAALSVPCLVDYDTIGSK